MERIIRRISLLFVFVLAGLVIFTFWRYGTLGPQRRSITSQDSEALDVTIAGPNSPEAPSNRRSVASIFFGEREVVPIDPKGQRVPERDGIFVIETSIAQGLNLKDLEK
jgi:hypothetical protein